jgi:flavorubredoxin
MQQTEIMKDIYWVGAVDWNIRDFHGYSTPKGTTYNAFLVLDEKVALFDTVKKGFKDDLMRHISKIIDPARIDYLVVNHVEMDHSSCVPEMMEICKPEKIICSSRGKQALLQHYHRADWPYDPVENGQTIRLGKRSVQFLETRMLHWPDSMFSYLKEDRLLISSDAFGQHWATSERFDDQVNQAELMDHAAKYYANILLLYSPLVQKLLSSMQERGLVIDGIAPDHGLIWRAGSGKIIEAYDAWSQQKPRRKALVIYDTMWESTASMARAIADGLIQEDVSVQVMDLRFTHRSDVMTQLLDAKALICGSSTLNNGMLPKMADLLHYIRGLKPLNKIGVSFGSFGWSGEGMKMVAQALEDMKAELVDPGIKVQYVPDAKSLEQCVELGRRIGKAVKERVAA